MIPEDIKATNLSSIAKAEHNITNQKYGLRKVYFPEAFFVATVYSIGVWLFETMIREIYTDFYETKKIFRKEYCYHVNVIAYALYAEKGKAVVMRTCEISKIVGVSKRTLQFYDDEGMIQVERTENNHRLYDEGTLKSLWEIMLYKEAGMELKEIKKILLMSENEKKQFYKGYIEKIKGRIQELEERERFITLFMEKGLPLQPEESAGVTYKIRINELRKGACL